MSRTYRIIYFSIFIILNIYIYLITQKHLDEKIAYSKNVNLHHVQVNYKIWSDNQVNLANVIYDLTIHNSQVIDTISKAWNTKDINERNKLRDELINLLKENYETYKNGGVLQYHFVFPDNTVFLRMHKIEKYGDNLASVRHDFEKVNHTHKIVRGFSQGRTSHAIRNIYPLFDANQSYIGSLDIAYPTELFQKKLNEISEIHTHFLVKKSIFKTNSWPRNDRIINYGPSIENENYFMTLTASHDPRNEKLHIMHLRKHKKEIDENMNQDKPFAIFSKVNSDIKIITFFPIFCNTTHTLTSWLVSYQNDPYIASAITETMNSRIIRFLFTIVLLIFIYAILQQKEKLNQLLKSYDKHVISSSTDTKGRITHASTAFCEISGYCKEDIIGKSHNIIRHPDMPKSTFKNLWKVIQSGDSWIGEIKNLRKDGTFYWVQAEVDPQFDSHHKIIGYTAIRHNITDTKEILEVQKDIIFTMGSIGEIRSKETANHVKRVAEYSKLLGYYYGLEKDELEMLHMASPMHDIGKVGIPDSILHKPEKLDDNEWKIMKTHVDKGYEMLKHSNRPLMKMAAIVASQHHEKYDGSGYPFGLIAEDIHIYGRITALADVYDALASNRVYKKAWEESSVVQHIKEQKGKHFDPKLVDVFFEHYDEFQAIKLKYADEC